MRRPLVFLAVGLLVPTVLLAGPGAGGGSAPAGGLLSDLVQLNVAGLGQDAQPAPGVQPPPPAPTPAPTAPILQNWTIGGWAEVAYTWNTNRPGETVPPLAGLPNAKENSFRVFDVNQDEFSIQQVALSAEKTATEGSWVGFKAVVLAGQDAKWIHSLGFFDLGTGPAGGGGEDIDVVDAYMTIKVPDRVFPYSTVFKFGKFETNHGSEVILAPGNLNYSRSYLFRYVIPFTHTELTASTSGAKRGETEAFGTDLAVVNGWDDVKDNNGSKSFMAGARFNPCDEFQFNVASMFGPEQKFVTSKWRGLVDLTA